MTDFATTTEVPAGQTSESTKPYFAYGSNLWLDQMKKRCKDSEYDCVAVLRGWKWIISSRHFANVVQSENDKDMVYGMIYQLTPEDEKKLDVNEGVARGNYVKYDLPVVVNAGQPGQEATVLALVYVDVRHQGHSFPHTEYIQRINLGIEDAVSVGVPEYYIEKSIRPFIPAPTPQIISAIAPDAESSLVADLKDGDSTGDIECRRLSFSENQKWIIQSLGSIHDGYWYIRSAFLTPEKQRIYINTKKSRSDYYIVASTEPKLWLVIPRKPGYLIATEDNRGRRSYWTFDAGQGRIRLSEPASDGKFTGQIWGIGAI